MITRNRAIDVLRKRKPDVDIADVVVYCDPKIFQSAEWSGTLEKIRGSLSSMPTPQRNAMEMAFFEGLTHTEIANKTGDPLGTIKTRIRSGLTALRKALNA